MEGYFEFREDELIDRYLAGKCSPEEQEQVEARLEKDQDFAEKIVLAQAVNDTIDRAAYERRIRGVIASVRKTDEERAGRRRWILGSGGALVAAGISFIIFLAYAPLHLNIQSQEIRAARTLERSHGVDSTGPGSAEKKKVFRLFFEAQSYLAEGNLQPAILNLEELMHTEGLRPYFREAVYWHLIVANMQNGNTDRAEKLYKEAGQPREYTIGTIDRWKVWWQLKRRKWLG